MDYHRIIDQKGVRVCSTWGVYVVRICTTTQKWFFESGFLGIYSPTYGNSYKVSPIRSYLVHVIAHEMLQYVTVRSQFVTTCIFRLTDPFIQL